MRNHKNIKNFIGGMLLVIAVLLAENNNFLPPILEAIYSIPGWLYLFSWNY